MAASRTKPPIRIRRARPDEYDDVAGLTVSTYVGDGLVSPDDSYVERLADVAGRAGETDLLVAVRGTEVVGSVALALAGGPYAEDAGPDDAVFRMLAVDPAARGLGIGEALVRACLQRAAAAGRQRMCISTQPDMLAAHRLYRRLGFTRRAQDWEPLPGVRLWRFERPLDDVT